MTTGIPNEISQQVLEAYLIIQQKVIENVSVTLLHIDKEYSSIAYGTYSAKPDKIWAFDIGTEKTSRDFFIHNPPTPGEVENAINVVEDEVMPLHKMLPANSVLYSIDADIREMVRYADYEENEYEMILTRTNMEQIFSRLAAIITGLPTSQDILPTSNSFASTLLILREVMHHLEFLDIKIIK